MRFVAGLSWMLGGEPPLAVDPRLLPLLRSIAETGSLAAAVADRGLSYRSAWGLLRAYRSRLGGPLVVLERGRGASLAPVGEQIVAADASAQRRLARSLQRCSVELAAPATLNRAPVPRLSIAASHDLALAALRDSLQAHDGLKLEISVMGSLEALEQYAEGHVDVAGFHLPWTFDRDEQRTPYLRWLRARNDRLIQFVDREQGLIVPRGNPARLKTFGDIADKQLRFVNRQRGSGTRLLIDNLLDVDAIDHARVVGYVNEEFTHAAVAATVASGGADAGFGLRAAAAKYDLAFVPLVTERYWLAVRSRALKSVPIARLVQALQSAAFKRIARRLPGYFPVKPGVVEPVAVLNVPSSNATRRSRRFAGQRKPP